MLGGFGVLGALLWAVPYLEAGASGLEWSGKANQILAICLWALGVLLLLVSRSARVLAKPVYVCWMSVAAAMGTVMTTVLLTLLYLFLLPVFSIIVRLGDPLRRKSKPGETYWEDYKPYEATLDRMGRPF